MKMSEFLELSDSEKVDILDQHGSDEDPYGFTEDKGVCFKCGGEVSVGDYCFGCHRLICEDCMDREPHASECPHPEYY